MPMKKSARAASTLLKNKKKLHSNRLHRSACAKTKTTQSYVNITASYRNIFCFKTERKSVKKCPIRQLCKIAALPTRKTTTSPTTLFKCYLRCFVLPDDAPQAPAEGGPLLMLNKRFFLIN